jgi:hypothetical protein
MGYIYGGTSGMSGTAFDTVLNCNVG